MEENNTSLKDIDEKLRIDFIANSWIEASRLRVLRDYNKVFRILENIFFTIYGFEFDNKEYLFDVTNIINQESKRIGGKPINLTQKLKIQSNIISFEDSIDQYYSLIAKALGGLGLWLKPIKVYNDLDEQISEETFGTNIKLLEEKIEDLKKLSTEELLKLMNPNHIHNAHSRYLINNGVGY